MREAILVYVGGPLFRQAGPAQSVEIVLQVAAVAKRQALPKPGDGQPW